MKVNELIDLRKKKMVWKSTVAAGKQPTTKLDVIGMEIGQTQSTGDTSRASENLKKVIAAAKVEHKRY